MIELVTGAEGILENEIGESFGRETNYITNNVPIIPHVPRGPPRRGGKELSPATPPREANEVAIAYSEGVTGESGLESRLPLSQRTADNVDYLL